MDGTTVAIIAIAVVAANAPFYYKIGKQNGKLDEVAHGLRAMDKRIMVMEQKLRRVLGGR